MYKYITKQSDVDSLLGRLMSKPAWGVDVETTGLDPHLNQVILLQIGRPDEQWVIDTRRVSVEPLRPFFESEEIKKIGHYLKFEYKMIKGSFGIELENLRCTFLGERLLYVGKKFSGFSLGQILKDRLGISLDKSLQSSFIAHQGDFTPAQLQYGADDVKHLLPLAQSLSEDLSKCGLGKTWLLECEFIPALGDMEFAGDEIDPIKWRALIESNQKKAEEVKAQMDLLTKDFCAVDLWGAVDLNYNSPHQVVKLLQQMRIKTQVRTPSGEWVEKLVTKSDDKTLKTVNKIPFVQLLKQWRSLQVRINTFGQPFLDAIHPKTGRIHAEFDQLGTETGRISKNRESAVNLLNIPKELEFRNAFVVGPDEVFETDDYDSFQLRIWADQSQDPELMEAFKRKEDVHCFVASLLYQRVVTKENENKHLRAPAKSLNFGIAFGQSHYSIYDDLVAGGFQTTREETLDLYNKYQDIFRTGVKYLREHGRMAVKQGYLSNVNGRRRYWNIPSRDHPKYHWAISSIEREGGNFMIQSVDAEITKRAMIEIRRYIKKHKIPSQMIKQVYDEIGTRTKKDASIHFHPKKVEIMKNVASSWIKTVPVVVGSHIGSCWTK